MKYFSDFSISYRRGSFSIARASGLNATRAVLKAGCSNLKPTGAQTRWPEERSAVLLVKVADFSKRSEVEMIKGCHVLPGLGASLDTYVRCALPMAIILRPFRVSRNF
jgi:hypothetical protein